MSTETTETNETNDNWGTCPKCGTPVLISPTDGTPEPCSECASRASPWGLFNGLIYIALGIFAIVLLIYVCIQILR